MTGAKLGGGAADSDSAFEGPGVGSPPRCVLLEGVLAAVDGNRLLGRGPVVLFGMGRSHWH